MHQASRLAQPRFNVRSFLPEIAITAQRIAVSQVPESDCDVRLPPPPAEERTGHRNVGCQW
jgi:hypothetical protein